MLNKLFEKYDSIIFIDTETTGLDFKNDKIIELSAVKTVCPDGKIIITDKLDDFILLPFGMKIPPEVENLTGITNEILGAEGIAPSEVCGKFADLFTDKKILVVAYNAQFDMNFIYYFLKENGRTDILKRINMLDAYTIYRDRHDYPHRLENAIEQYNLSEKVQNSHRAIDDTLALIEVLKAMDS
ncbi:MAG: 3'-5' exonuclease, partial [Clostridia bacterium]|nr:3'-5' exonuclease [Clostridia bacterium]